MDAESLIVAQIVRLFRQHRGVVWELRDASGSPRAGDLPLRDKSDPGNTGGRDHGRARKLKSHCPKYVG